MFSKNHSKNISVSFSELNLNSLPIFNFSKKLPKEEKYQSFTKEWFEQKIDERGKKINIKRSITVRPHEQYGILQAFDYMVLQALFLLIRKKQFEREEDLTVPEFISFKPIELQRSLEEISISKSNRLDNIKISLKRLRATELQFDKNIFMKDKIKETELTISILASCLWVGEHSPGRKSAVDQIEIALNPFIRKNINENLVLLFSLDTIKSLKTPLAKRSFQYIFWRFYQRANIEHLGSYPDKKKTLLYRKNYIDFVSFFLLKTHKEYQRVLQQIKSILDELLRLKVIKKYEIEKGIGDFVLSIISGEQFIKDYIYINKVKGKQKDQITFDFSLDHLQFDEVTSKNKLRNRIENFKNKIHLFIEKFVFNPTISFEKILLASLLKKVIAVMKLF